MKGRPLGFTGLTEREHELLGLVVRGKGNAAIAAELHLSIKSVQNHVNFLLGKTRCPSRAALVARDQGLGTDG